MNLNLNVLPAVSFAPTADSFPFQPKRLFLSEKHRVPLAPQSNEPPSPSNGVLPQGSLSLTHQTLLQDGDIVTLGRRLSRSSTTPINASDTQLKPIEATVTIVVCDVSRCSRHTSISQAGQAHTNSVLAGLRSPSHSRDSTYIYKIWPYVPLACLVEIPPSKKTKKRGLSFILIASGSRYYQSARGGMRENHGLSIEALPPREFEPSDAGISVRGHKSPGSLSLRQWLFQLRCRRIVRCLNA
ncbi:hypothetical protein BU15DRAFT_61467 [Melanogaster broomeanus]|nr:hypothetical protein BU15DRAFT_61467 [Melanogaster broomeanus]